MKLASESEWSIHFRDWALIQIRSGICYWQQPNLARDLPIGSVLLVAGDVEGVLRASLLGEVEIAYFCVEPQKFTGIMSLSEMNCLKKLETAGRGHIQIYSPEHPVAVRFGNLALKQDSTTLSGRLQLIQLFVDSFEGRLESVETAEGAMQDSRNRLRHLLGQISAVEFVGLSLRDFAPRVGCSPRHLSRLFIDETGLSFKAKQTELRLTNACNLLSDTDIKISEVAAASGYNSNSLFNLLFKKRFGFSPGEWRQRNKKPEVASPKPARTFST